MSGITGFLSFSGSEKSLSQQNDRLVKRGPDDTGIYFESPIGLAQRNLGKLNPDFKLPHSIGEGNSIIVFDGRIENIPVLKEELELPEDFIPDEILVLKTIEKWGVKEGLNKLRGPFALAVWDRKQKKLFVARDHLGIRPLYYTRNKNGFFFGSELKAIDAEIDKNKISNTALNLFFSLTYIPEPYSIYEDVFKLKSGHYLEVNEDGFKEITYFDAAAFYKESKANPIESYEYAKDKLRRSLYDSVKRQMETDLPVGSFLSGGIDSAVISAVMSELNNSPINTYSIGFREKEYDESSRARLVANRIKSNHHLFMVDHNDLLEIVDETLTYFDEPFGDSSAVPSMIVAQKASEKAKVVLTGDCADELFGGYEKYLAGYYAKKFNAYPGVARKPFEAIVNLIPHTSLTNETLRKMKKVIQSANLTPPQRYLSLNSLGYKPSEKKALLDASYHENVQKLITQYFDEIEGDELTRTFYSDLRLVLEGDMFQKVDRTSRLNSLDARAPFMDFEILELSASIPHKFKIDGIDKKRILKDTFAHVLPEETIGFAKRGFGLPLKMWFQNELKNELTGLLTEKSIKEQGILNWEYIDKLMKEHQSNKENHSSKLWQLFVFQKWYNREIN